MYSCILQCSANQWDMPCGKLTRALQNTNTEYSGIKNSPVQIQNTNANTSQMQTQVKYKSGHAMIAATNTIAPSPLR